MCFDTAPFAGQCDVDEIFVISEIFEGRCYATLVVVPTKTKMLRLVHGDAMFDDGV